MERETIGIGIITHNRREVFMRTYREINRYMPEGANLVVVDDYSDVPLEFATVRTSRQRGIAGASNVAFSLLDQNDHIFLFNDDTFPSVKDWYLPYINSGLAHLCMSFEWNSRGQRLSHSVYVTERNYAYWVYNAPNGCMLYLRKECLQSVGGMNEEFGIWGHEHVEFSQRIHNAGLTPYPFMDVPDSIRYITPLDYFGSVRSSVVDDVRIDHIRKNGAILEANIESSKFIEYRVK